MRKEPDIYAAIGESEMFDFLIDIVPEALSNGGWEEGQRQQESAGAKAEEQAGQQRFARTQQTQAPNVGASPPIR